MGDSLKVILAGMNYDLESLNLAIKCISSEGFPEMSLEESINLAHETLLKSSPETISASYARISRDPRSIPELREIARREVEKSRTTNEAIIFDMGHKSIAEHVIFNLDIMGISRRVIEELEEKRLVSYTEKSQRYITLDGDFVTPQEIRNTPLEKEFVNLIEEQNEFYNNNLQKITRWHIKRNPEVDLDLKRARDKIEGFGKEDARYALAMATQTQVGTTISARNLETLVTKLRSSESKEAVDLGEKILEVVKGTAPSVVKYTEPIEYYTKTRKELKDYVEEIIHEKDNLSNLFVREAKLISKNVGLFTGLKRDNSILAGIIFSSSKLPFKHCLHDINDLEEEEKEEILRIADSYQRIHDPKIREYELGDRVAEIELSSSAFAQMKRHRMNTIIPQQYDINLPPTIPESIIKTGLKKEFLKVVEESSKVYSKMISEGLPTIVAEYILTNAHKRRILLDANNRQVYAICAERENMAAQWDIRNIIGELHFLMRQESPLTLAYLCGKDRFEEVKERRYSQNE